MTVNLQEWCGFLRQAQPSDSSSPHLWICQVQRHGGQSHIEAISQDQYNDLTQAASGSYCRKLLLVEIVSISKEMLSNMAKEYAGTSGSGSYKLSVKVDMALEIGKILSANIFSEDIEAIVTKKLKHVKDNADMLQAIPSALEKMNQRSREKKIIEKTKSIWGKMMWYIWSWFFDSSSEIKKIERSAPNLGHTLETAYSTIKERVILNMDLFEEEIKVNEKERNHLEDDVTLEKFDAPNKVKKLWLTKFAEDKLHQKISEQADTYRKRIIALLKVWETIIKFQQTENIPKYDKNLDKSKVETQLLLS